MEIVLFLFVVALLFNINWLFYINIIARASIFVFTSDKSFYPKFVGTKEQKKGLAGYWPGQAMGIKGLSNKNQRKEVFFIFLYIGSILLYIVYIGSIPLMEFLRIFITNKKKGLHISIYISLFI